MYAIRSYYAAREGFVPYFAERLKRFTHLGTCFSVAFTVKQKGKGGVGIVKNDKEILHSGRAYKTQVRFDGIAFPCIREQLFDEKSRNLCLSRLRDFLEEFDMSYNFV